MILWFALAIFLSYVAFAGNRDNRPSGLALLVAFGAASVLLAWIGPGPG